MIRDDIENLNFKELSELEQREYVAALIYNARKLVLQLTNGGELHLASLISIGTSFAVANPMRLNDLVQYAIKLFQTVELEQEIIRRNSETLNKEKEEETDSFPPLDTEKLH